MRRLDGLKRQRAHCWQVGTVTEGRSTLLTVKYLCFKPGTHGEAAKERDGLRSPNIQFTHSGRGINQAGRAAHGKPPPPQTSEA